MTLAEKVIRGKEDLDAVYRAGYEAGKAEGNTPKIIRFTAGLDYLTAEEGMTWGAWVYSEYNTVGIVIGADNKVMRDGKHLAQGPDSPEKANDVIGEEECYSWWGQKLGMA